MVGWLGFCWFCFISSVVYLVVWLYRLVGVGFVSVCCLGVVLCCWYWWWLVGLIVVVLVCLWWWRVVWWCFFRFCLGWRSDWIRWRLWSVGIDIEMLLVLVCGVCVLVSLVWWFCVGVLLLGWCRIGIRFSCWCCGWWILVGWFLGCWWNLVLLVVLVE